MDLTLLEELRAKLGLATLGKPALIGLAAIMVMVAVFAGRMIIDTATATPITIEHGEDVISSDGGKSSGGVSAAARADVSAASSAGQDGADTLFVHVTGAVGNPGLVELTCGSRVADAIEAAGGVTEDADLDLVNLARKVADGEQVHVYLRDEQVDVVSTEVLKGQQSVSAVSPGLVNVNVATQVELEALPGIGPSTAQKIIADREANGPFSTVQDLTRVSGIGEKKLESISALVCV